MLGIHPHKFFGNCFNIFSTSTKIFLQLATWPDLSFAFPSFILVFDMIYKTLTGVKVAVTVHRIKSQPLLLNYQAENQPLVNKAFSNTVLRYSFQVHLLQVKCLIQKLAILPSSGFPSSYHHHSLFSTGPCSHPFSLVSNTLPLRQNTPSAMHSWKQASLPIARVCC